MTQIYLYLTKLSKNIQPSLLKFPFLLRIKELIKQTYFLLWQGRITDVYILSFPKSGRTWLRVLIGKTLAQLFSVDEKGILNTFQLTRSHPIPVIQFNHDGTDLQYARSYQNLASYKKRYREKKIILLVREPRDLVVSNYFQATKRENAFKGNISEFIRDPRYGIKKILKFYDNWIDNNFGITDMLVIRYEDLYEDPIQKLEEILEFIGIDGITNQIINEAVEFSSFSNMKKLERGGFFNKNSMLPGNQKDQKSYKVRKGKIGGYIEELSHEDLIYIRDVIQKMGSPFYSN